MALLGSPWLELHSQLKREILNINTEFFIAFLVGGGPADDSASPPLRPDRPLHPPDPEHGGGREQRGTQGENHRLAQGKAIVEGEEVESVAGRHDDGGGERGRQTGNRLRGRQ